MNDGSGQAGKSVAIIGGGIAGLCAGCYAQMNGYRSRIYEMHDLPGGLMTAWERKGYTVDYCIHWLVGSSPKASMHKLWQEVGLLRDRQIVDLDVWAGVRGPRRAAGHVLARPRPPRGRALRAVARRRRPDQAAAQGHPAAGCRRPARPTCRRAS